MLKKIKKYFQRKNLKKQMQIQKYRDEKFKNCLIARKEFQNVN